MSMIFRKTTPKFIALCCFIGYRVDAAKHMWPSNLDTILGRTRRTKSGKIPFVYQEVIDQSGAGAIKSSDYQHIGRVTEFKYSKSLVEYKTSDNCMYFCLNQQLLNQCMYRWLDRCVSERMIRWSDRGMDG